MTWRPILGDDGGIVDAVAKEVAAVGSDDPTLANGHAGLALFFAYLWRIRGEERDGDVAMSYLERAIEGVAAGDLGPGLFTGFTGVAWVAHHLAQPEFSDDDTDVTADIDDALLQLLGEPWTGDYDLVSGLTGIGVYALDHPIADRGAALLDAVVGQLETLAVSDADGASWHTPARLLPPAQAERFGDGYTNVGLAHGVPGPVAMLARAGDRGRPLLQRATRWLLARRGEEGFPAFVAGPRVVPNSRSAWCYGDAGVATALWAAGCDEGREVARRDLARPMTAAGVVDGGLCHGATSLAHLANRWFQASGDEAFAAGARRWFDALSALRRPGQGVAGFTAVAPGDAHEARPGYLTGSAGIALALLAATSDVVPAWDTPLLATLPVR